MEVIFLMRIDAFNKTGGDTQQIKNYVKELNKLGVNATISTDLSIDLSNYDIVNLVNIDRPIETWEFYKKAKRLEKKIVLISIHHSYEQINHFEKTQRSGVLRLINVFARDFWKREKVKNLIRSINHPELFTASLKMLFSNVKEKQKEIIRESDLVITLAEKEAIEINRDFDLTISTTDYLIVKNGVNLPSKQVNFKKKKYDVLVVGRIEPRKNQLNIIKALAGSDIKVLFVGKENGNSKSYVNEFKKQIKCNENMSYLGAVEYEKMKEVYMASKVHLSASWFEVTPLVDIEALYFGCNIVTTENSFSEEYLGEFAEFVNPSNIEDIKGKIIKSLGKPQIQNAQVYIKNNFNWERSTKLLFESYNKILIREGS
ncbi:glycosyltransferase [Shouchella lehensis]|uniref:Glycosyltransferase family 1 protein n=1 Tax=Shouchella lehensis TaxID=300825 RepID=A0A4Y7WFR7_9BACI|nr:glycosyltransferase [Shouchella lehensis]MBG9785020.1 hypothetical protein [Shouchella lehensis]TES46443.1 glycosyltransferase family 1 protein [Shouchella lehensis]